MSPTLSVIKSLGEAAIRVSDLDTMSRFYEEILGLQVIRKEEGFVFFKIAKGYGGHSQNLALFKAEESSFLVSKSDQLSPENSTLHHLAFNIDLEDFEAEQSRLTRLGISVQEVEHPWIHVRSLYFPDPENNLLEFVSFDPSLK